MVADQPKCLIHPLIARDTIPKLFSLPTNYNSLYYDHNRYIDNQLLLLAD